MRILLALLAIAACSSTKSQQPASPPLERPDPQPAATPVEPAEPAEPKSQPGTEIARTAGLVRGDAGDAGLITSIWAPLRKPVPGDPVEVVLHWQGGDAQRTWLEQDHPLAAGKVNWTRSLASFVIVVRTAEQTREVPLTSAGGGAAPTSLFLQPTISLVLSGKTVVASFDRSSVMTRIAEGDVGLAQGVPTAVSVRGQLVWMSGRTIDFESPAVTIEKMPTGRPLKELVELARAEAKKRIDAMPERKAGRKVEHYGIDRDRDDGTRVISFVAPGAIWQLDRVNVEVTPDGKIVGHTLAKVFTCVGEGTDIGTPGGPVAVESLKVGDTVIGYDTRARREVETTVTATARHSARRTVRIGAARLTGEHPVYSGGRFVAAGSLSRESTVLTRAGPRPAMAGPAERLPVYELSVAPPHTYFAGGVLVHNKSVRGGPWLSDPWRFAAE